MRAATSAAWWLSAACTPTSSPNPAWQTSGWSPQSMCPGTPSTANLSSLTRGEMQRRVGEHSAAALLTCTGHWGLPVRQRQLVDEVGALPTFSSNDVANSRLPSVSCGLYLIIYHLLQVYNGVVNWFLTFFFSLGTSLSSDRRFTVISWKYNI